MSSSKSRRSFSAEQKVEIVRRHLVDKVTVSELCETYDIQPSVYYSWQTALFAQGTAAFEKVDRSRPTRERQLQAQVEKLAEVVQRKDRVIAQISEEYVTLKKECGEL